MNEKKTLSNKQYKYVIAAVIILNLLFATITACILIQRFQTTSISPNAKFILAGWDYPDEYGQGISSVYVHENSTGSWEPVYDPAFLLSTDSSELEMPADEATAIRLQPSARINHTLHSLGDYDDAKAIMRLNVTVWHLDEVIFSKQNLTLEGAEGVATATTWWIAYEVVLDFLIQEYQIYVIELTYEIYYENLEYGGAYLHDCSNLNDITYHSNAGLDPEDYGIGSDGDIIETWIVPDSSVDERVIYKLDFTNIDNSDGDINLTVRYRVEDEYIGFRLDLYYTDVTAGSTGLIFSQTWTNATIVADSGKTLDYVLFRCDDYPNSVSSGNRSIYIDFIEITNPTDTLAYWAERWNEVTTATFYLDVQMSESTVWAFNNLHILLGFGLIVGSGVYLAKGGRDEISFDKGFYVIVAFMIGWALVIGVVMP